MSDSARTSSGAPPQSGWAGSDAVWSVVSLLAAGPAVWGGVGYLLDGWLGTPAFTPAGVVLGSVLAFYVIWVRFFAEPQDGGGPGPRPEQEDLR